jgi:hypothetical protein
MLFTESSNYELSQNEATPESYDLERVITSPAEFSRECSRVEGSTADELQIA